MMEYFMATMVLPGWEDIIIDTWILQNNIDKFDGTGPSGMNVNYQLGNNYIIQEQWPWCC
jgi:hypothetical protein